jgi:signal transduction histidine kinase
MLALDDLPQDSPIRGDMKTIIQASERARDLVKQILAFARKQDLVKQPVDLALVAGEALRMLRSSLPATVQLAAEAWLSPTAQMLTAILPITAPIAWAALATRLTTTWCSPTGSPKTGGTPLISSTR